jgi:hypothetical protein
MFTEAGKLTTIPQSVIICKLTAWRAVRPQGSHWLRLAPANAYDFSLIKSLLLAALKIMG